MNSLLLGGLMQVMTVRDRALNCLGFNLVRNALSDDMVGRLRATTTGPAAFRGLVHQLTGIVLSAAIRDVIVGERSVETPMGLSTARFINSEVALVPVLRAGLGMMFGGLQFLPDAKVYCLGMYRDEKSLEPVPYYNKLPDTVTADVLIILDIMLATGGSICDAIDALKRYNTPIKVATLIAAPEGVLKVLNTHPDVEIFSVALDDCLNDSGYIVPGLGDAGDRYFNT